jgi:hypothetical protein
MQPAACAIAHHRTCNRRPGTALLAEKLHQRDSQRGAMPLIGFPQVNRQHLGFPLT